MSDLPKIPTPRISRWILDERVYGQVNGHGSVRDLVGKTVYVLREEPYGPIVGIANLPTERGSAFVFSEVFGS